AIEGVSRSAPDDRGVRRPRARPGATLRRSPGALVPPGATATRGAAGGGIHLFISPPSTPRGEADGVAGDSPLATRRRRPRPTPRHPSVFGPRSADPALLAPRLPSPPRMTHTSVPTPQHDGDSSASRAAEPSAGGRVAGLTRGRSVDRELIDGRR